MGALKDTHKYDDIIHLPRPAPKNRVPMSNYDRAAQFSPFAALTGYDGVIQETARLTDARIELDEGGKALLDEAMGKLREQIDRCPRTRLTCFRPDERKTGGAYVQIVGHVEKIDEYQHILVLQEGPVIPLGQIYAIECD